MFKILDRYLTREILLPSFLALVVLTFVLEIPPILREAEALIAKGVAWTIVGRVLLTAAAAGAQHHDSDGAPPRHPDRLRPHVGRSRVRRAAGVRRQPLPAAAADRAARRARHGGDRLRDDCRTAERQPDVPRDHARRGRRQDRQTGQAARLLRGVPQPRDLRAATCRRPAAGATCFSPTPPTPITRRCISPRKAGSASTRRRRRSRCSC